MGIYDDRSFRWPVAILVALLFTLTALAGYILFDLSKTRGTLLRTFMMRPLESIKLQLDGFLIPISQLSDMAVNHAKEGVYAVNDSASINTYFVHLLESHDQLTSVGLADTTGYEYDILRSGTEWRTRSVRPDLHCGRNHWGCWDRNMDTSSARWWEPMQADPRSRPWYLGAMEKDGSQHWTGPYLFNTDRVFGVTLSTLFPLTDGMGILALDVSLERLSKFTSELRIGDRGGAFLLTRNLEFIGLPTDTSNIITQVAHLVTKAHMRARVGGIVKVTVNGESWCGRLVRYELDRENHLFAGVVIPEAEMMTEVNLTLNIIMVGMVLTMVFIGSLVVLLMRLKNANITVRASAAQIAVQNTVISHRNRELQESLNYAQRIQQVVLPPLERMGGRTMFERMLLYMPKETVSGDFYWAVNRGQVSHFAVADCTGHGVSGAMMSILGIDLLNASLGMYANAMPEHLLYQLRQVLIQRMRAGDDTVVRDGMDIGLCRLNHDSQLLDFAGAFLSLHIVRAREQGDTLILQTNGRTHYQSAVTSSATHHLFIIKGDRQPIGYVSEEDKGVFTGHELLLSPGDSVYMMTDGFADQFGGERDRKFGQQRLRELLLAAESVRMEHRSALMRSVLQQHMGEREQVDDICVFGFVAGTVDAETEP